MLLCSLKQVFWKKSTFYYRYLRNLLIALFILSSACECSIFSFINGISKVVITWSRIGRMKFCPALPESRQSYKLFINYTLRLHVKRFIQARRDPSFVQPGSRFARTKFSHVIASARLGGIKKLIIEDISIVSLRPIWRQSVRKKVNKYLCRISSFYRSSHRRCSAKKVFLKILQYSQENNCVGVSLRAFRSAILSKRDSSADVFLWILRNF